jgi:prepilin-type N-terminal cleavage/methylation domain-containing protein
MKRRGFTLVEVMTSTVLVSVLIMSALALLSSSLSSFNKTDKRLEMSDEGAIALRKVSEELRSAVVVDILSSGREVAFELPLRNTHADPVTGEYEYATPVVTDGIDRRYYVTNDGDLMY